MNRVPPIPRKDKKGLVSGNHSSRNVQIIVSDHSDRKSSCYFFAPGFNFKLLSKGKSNPKPPHLTSDWLHTGSAALGKELAEALGAVGLVVAAREPLAGQRGLAMAAGEAVAVPWLVLVGHAAAGDDLGALDAAGRVLFLVAARAVDVVLTGNKGLGADGRLADAAAEALFVPLSRFVLHLLGACGEG